MSQKAVETKKEIAFTKAFSTFSVNDLQAAKEFYTKIGIEVNEEPEGLSLSFDGGSNVFIYPKPDHTPATFTVLNFPVDDISVAVNKLVGLGIAFEKYEGEMATDANGIFWGKRNGHGPNIAWFKDSAGNFLSVIETK